MSTPILKRCIAAAVLAVAAAMPAGAVRIALFSDIHVTPGNANDSALRRAVQEVNAGDCDMVIINGDLTNEGSDAEIANVRSILDSITKPLYVLPGNHENTWSQSATKTFVDTFGADRILVDGDSLVIVGINCGPYMKMGDGHIKREDMLWLKDVLEKARAEGKPVLSLNHYPIRQDDLDNWRDYADLLLQYPVIGHINGHYHRWLHYDVGDLPGVMVRALDMKKGNYGYAVVDVQPGWTLVYDKPLGREPQSRFAFANRREHAPLKGQGRPAWTAPEGWDVKLVWTDSASIFTRVGIDGERLYFGNSLGQARAVNKADGTVAWTLQTPAPLFSRPTVLEGNRVAVPTCNGIDIVDAARGRVIRHWPSAGGPYVADGLCQDKHYIQGAYKRIESRHPRTGKVQWVYDSLYNYCQAAPVIDGNDLIFGAWDTNLRCLDLNTGRLKWVWNNGKSANMLGPGNVVPVVTGDKVITVAPDRYMTALDRRTGRQLWRDNSHKYRESLGVSTDGAHAYAKTMDGELVSVATAPGTFTEEWTLDMGLGYEHAPCIVAQSDGVVYAGSRRGIVTAVDPTVPAVLWSLPLGVSEVNGIDIDPTNGDVYVSLIEGTVFRISKNKK